MIHIKFAMKASSTCPAITTYSTDQLKLDTRMLLLLRLDLFLSLLTICLRVHERVSDNQWPADDTRQTWQTTLVRHAKLLE